MDHALNFNEQHLLPEGVHDATLAEIERHFARFQRTDRRIKLFEKLSRFLKELQGTNWRCEVILDGSFVMPAVDEPGDIDLLLVLPDDWDMSIELRPFEYNLVSSRRVRDSFGFDLKVAIGTSEEYRKWIEFFSRVNVKWSTLLNLPAESRKGLVRVIP
jgi:hypothetical protein